MNLEIFQNQPVLKIQSGDASALVSPAHGARLLSWSVPGWDIIGWPTEADWDRVAKVRGGDPLLFPFIARTYANGRIGSWIDASGVQRPAPMHGFAKDSPFRILEAGEDSVTLRLDSNETTMACYPFPFRLEVTHRIDSDALLTSFRVANRGDQSMPWSAGHHYYFHVPAAERADSPCLAKNGDARTLPMDQFPSTRPLRSQLRSQTPLGSTASMQSPTLSAL
jgi:aldose 1-epimerase